MVKIAIVEDNPNDRIKIREMLGSFFEREGRGFTVDEFPSAIDFFVKYQPIYDLIFMDIDMPEMDGVSTVEVIRETHHDLAVVFLTAIANRDTVLRCNKVGAKDYILKPVNPIYLRERIEIALDKNKDR